MTTKNRYLLLIASLLMLLCNPAAAQYGQDYSTDNPVVIVCDWDFPPYEYSNNDGNPDGFNIELLQAIFKKLHIPCRFLLMEWSDAKQAFERREADLIIDPSDHYHTPPYIRSTNILNYYKVVLVLGKGARPVNDLSEMTGSDTLILKRNDYAANRIIDEQQLGIPVEYRSPKDALAGICDGRYRYFIWGEGPLMWKKKELALDTLITSAINIPDGEIRIVGYDKQLIDAIDDEFARMEQSGELQPINDKWFHPDRTHDNTSPVAIIVLVGAVIAIIIVLLLSRLVKSRVRNAIKRSADLNNMMQQALKMGSYNVFEIDRTAHMFYNIHGNLLPDKGYRKEEFQKYLHPDDLRDFRGKIDAMVQGKAPQWSYTWRMNKGTETKPEWHWLNSAATIEQNNRKSSPIIVTVKDITRQVEEERINMELSTKYTKIFETNIIAMSFYDKDGWLINANDNMRQLCKLEGDNWTYFSKTNLFEAPLFKDQYPRNARYVFHACQHMFYSELGLNRYIELRIRPTYDAEGKLQYYVLTSRDVTEERAMTLRQQHHTREMLRIGEAINQYESQLQYLLEKSDMFVWQFDIATRQINFSRSLRTPSYSMSRDELIANMVQEEREQADKKLNEMIRNGTDFNATHHFSHMPSSPDPCWYVLSGVPDRQPDGSFTRYYGVARNITKLMEAQQKLRQETYRAENSSRMKSAFLANMTHEIRTPLNAIVGFSDLLLVIDNQEERMEFIRIIRNNCDMLMRLINDILEASSMGQDLAIQPTEIDFALVFDDICQTLAQRVQEPGVEFIKDNPYSSCATILDTGRVQQVLTNFVTNAVKYTHQGYIKVGYHWDRRQKADGSGEADGLLFYSLDSGAGIPKEKQASVFERFVKLDEFVQGTGLGLSICQNIANRCNGQIGVTSDGPGHGSTFWMWIPCPKL